MEDAVEQTRRRWQLVGVVAVQLFTSPLWADIAITGDDWNRHVSLGSEFGVPPPAVVTTADGLKALHLTRPAGDKFAIYLFQVTKLPAGKSRFPIRVVARQVQDSVNGLGVRNLTIDPDDPNSDTT